ncbi:hypothetical protein NMY22_g19791 [Coprinellus aureogranulatus]|nr:hypothetical protein NMY22_g19791 [Coprinellus aureogranulatus]
MDVTACPALLDRQHLPFPRSLLLVACVLILRVGVKVGVGGRSWLSAVDGERYTTLPFPGLDPLLYADAHNTDALTAQRTDASKQ